MKLTFVPAGCNIVTINKPSYAQCVESCEHVYNCIAVTYEDIGTCELLEIGAEIAWEMYALETNNDFIHATKNGTVGEYLPIGHMIFIRRINDNATIFIQHRINGDATSCRR